MDFNTRMRLAKRIEQEAANWGYSGDAWDDCPPMVGTYRQQLAIIEIGARCPPGPMSSRDRYEYSRMLRSVVLGPQYANDLPVFSVDLVEEKRPAPARRAPVW